MRLSTKTCACAALISILFKRWCEFGDQNNRHTWNFIKFTCKKRPGNLSSHAFYLKLNSVNISLFFGNIKKSRLACISCFCGFFCFLKLRLSWVNVHVNALFTRFWGEEQHTSGWLHSFLMNILKAEKKTRGFIQTHKLHILCTSVCLYWKLCWMQVIA